jgi:DNA transposition AAA+ family ATPase
MTQVNKESPNAKATPNTARLQAAVQEIRTGERLGLRPLAEMIRKAAGRESLAHSALGDWLNGTYTGEWGPIEEAVQAWLDSRAEAVELEEKRSSLAVPQKRRFERFAQTVMAQTINRAISTAHARGDLNIVVARPGMGKSRCTREYKARYSSLIYLRAMEGMTTRDAVRELASLVGARTTGSNVAIAEDIKLKVGARRMAFIFDEVEFLPMRFVGLIRGIREDLDDELGLVLIGTPEFLQRLRSGVREYAYIWSRVDAVMEVVLSDAQKRHDFSALISAQIGSAPDDLVEEFVKTFDSEFRKGGKFFHGLLQRSIETSQPISAELFRTIVAEKKRKGVMR